MIDWADQASTGLAGYDDGMGSWLSTFWKNNQNTIGSILGGVIGAVGTNIIGAAKPAAAAPAAPVVTPPPAAPAMKQETNWLPIAAAGVGLILLLRK